MDRVFVCRRSEAQKGCGDGRARSHSLPGRHARERELDVGCHRVQPAGWHHAGFATGGTPESLVRVRPGETAVRTAAAARRADAPVHTGYGRRGDISDKATIVAQSLKSGSRQTLVQVGSSARFIRTGHLVYLVNGVLFAVPFNPVSLRVTANPVPVVEGVTRGAASVAEYAVSESGSLVYAPGPASASSRLSRLVTIDDRGSVGVLNPVARRVRMAADCAGRQTDRVRRRRREDRQYLDLRSRRPQCGPTSHVRRQQPFSGLVCRRAVCRVSIRSRRRPGGLPAAGRRQRRRGGTADHA